MYTLPFTAPNDLTAQIPHSRWDCPAYTGKDLECMERKGNIFPKVETRGKIHDPCKQEVVGEVIRCLPRKEYGDEACLC